MSRKTAIALLSTEVRETLEQNQGKKVDLPFVNKNAGAALFVDISGFTKLGKKFRSEENDHGVAADKLSTEIMSALGTLTSICYLWGGDVIKFAGDALICTWKVTNSRTMTESLALARRTAYEMKKTIEVGDGKLKLHGGVGSGSLMYIHLGNDQIRWHLVSGSAIVKAAELLQASAKDEIIYELEPSTSLHAESINHVHHHIRFFNKDKVNGIITNKTSVDNDIFFAQDFPESQRDINSWEKVLKWEGIKTYLPDQVRQSIEGGRDDSGEIFSNISTMFVSLDNLIVNNMEFKFNEIEKKKLNKLNFAFMTMTKIVQQYHGEIRDLLFDDKGCVFIAVFGAYTGEEMSELRCVRAADYISRGLPDCRIGASVGPCYAGLCGSENRIDFIVMGHDVNQAARLMAGAQLGQILVDPAIMQATKEFMGYDPVHFKLKGETFNCYSLTDERLRTGTFIAKVRNLKQRNMHQVFIPRDHEMEKISRILDREDESMAGILIKGKEGMGKSCLVQQILEKAGHDSDVYFAATFVLEERTTFFVARQLLHSLLNLDKSELELNKHSRRGSIQRVKSNKSDPGRSHRITRNFMHRGRKHREKMKTVIPIEQALKERDIDYQGYITKYFVPEVMSTLNKNNNRTVILRKNDLYRMQEMRDSTLAHELTNTEMTASTDFFVEVFGRRVGKHKKTLIVVEDMQWIDPASLQLLCRMMAMELPNLTFLFTTRPVHNESKLGKKKQKTFEKLIGTMTRNNAKNNLTINLSCLNREQSEELSMNVLMDTAERIKSLNRAKENVKLEGLGVRVNASEYVDQEVLDIVYDRTEGHPSHLALLVKWLVEQKYVTRHRTGKFHFNEEFGSKSKEQALTHVPQELERIIRYHKNELPGRLERVLKVAAVLGKAFSFEQLKEVLRLDDLDSFEKTEDLHLELRKLQEFGFIQHVDDKKLNDMSVASMGSGIKYRVARYLSSDSQNPLDLNWKFQDDITQEVILKSIPRKRLSQIEKRRDKVVELANERAKSAAKSDIDDYLELAV